MTGLCPGPRRERLSPRQASCTQPHSTEVGMSPLHVCTEGPELDLTQIENSVYARNDIPHEQVDSLQGSGAGTSTADDDWTLMSFTGVRIYPIKIPKLGFWIYQQLPRVTDISTKLQNFYGINMHPRYRHDNLFVIFTYLQTVAFNPGKNQGVSPFLPSLSPFLPPPFNPFAFHHKAKNWGCPDTVDTNGLTPMPAKQKVNSLLSIWHFCFLFSMLQAGWQFIVAHGTEFVNRWYRPVA